MNDPISQGGMARRSCRKIVDLVQGFLVKHLLRPIVFLMPPAILTWVATREGLQSDLSTWIGPGATEFVSGSALLTILGAYLYIVLLKALYAGIERCARPEKEMNANDLVAVIKSLDYVVDDKAQRISRAAKEAVKRGSVCGGDVFMDITKPGQQLLLLVKGIRSVFEYLDDTNANFRVGLLKVSNQKPVEWYAFDPASEPPRTPPGVLSAPSSTVSHSIKSKSLVVVDDIQKELAAKKSKGERRFLRGNTQDGDDGSQLCYPIIHPASGEVEYVVTIAGDKAKCLKGAYGEIYSWVIRHFAVRMILEHSLLMLREKANGTNEKAA